MRASDSNMTKSSSPCDWYSSRCTKVLGRAASRVRAHQRRCASVTLLSFPDGIQEMMMATSAVKPHCWPTVDWVSGSLLALLRQKGRRTRERMTHLVKKLPNA
jgi:hypothetical protein